jgi:hypothetical protein
MSSTTTSTLRRNRFKPLIFSSATRVAIVDSFLDELGPYLKAWREGQLESFMMVGIYWVLLIKNLRPRDYKVGQTPWAADLKLDSDQNDAFSLWSVPLSYRLRSCPLGAHAIFYKWFKKEVDLVVTEQLPTSVDVLNLQCEGSRFVTLVTDPELFISEIEGRDPLSFLLHDLVHADKFFSKFLLSHDQVNYFIELKARYQSGEFNELLKQQEFNKKFDYLISDMNSHPEHMKAYLNHIILEAQNTSFRSTGFDVLLSP